ncbi:hypothetical protein OBBRIDRAFT_383677 [Obba rivulosa]|uniref:Uncharacterized protein n=1 Tax=Obba rivulosa TaxID=1052685 RepID=A0A8E2AMU0_9APHY|nr:hypothetical protein OBBRIDRAFT_383677 [Obba rivulosa]
MDDVSLGFLIHQFSDLLFAILAVALIVALHALIVYISTPGALCHKYSMFLLICNYTDRVDCSGFNLCALNEVYGPSLDCGFTSGRRAQVSVDRCIYNQHRIRGKNTSLWILVG